jgi:hypothetical protein
MVRETELADTLENSDEPKSSGLILEALQDAEKHFEPYFAFCRATEKAYTLANESAEDEAFALFWASMEILKPAIYAKPPKPIASARFKDGGKVEKTAAELIERNLESTFDRGGIDDVMLGCRDDLALTNRGVAWCSFESDSDGGGQRVCIEHLDRTDFLHEPARKWADVGWVARRAWMTKTQMKKRFKKVGADLIDRAGFEVLRDRNEYGAHDGSAKSGVWEVWSKVDDQVYWVAEGVNEILDQSEPHLNLHGFFPCPKPAYGTTQRRTLLPVPDYKRYQSHLDQINELTNRIYTLLAQVRLKVLVPGGGDIGDAVMLALKSSDDSIIIPVPAMAMAASAGAGNLMLTLPLVEVAETIQGLIAARGQLIEDFYQLSGISDIMRGATEAQETATAQNLKSQYGSVRVRDKIDELQRLARDTAHIAAEIMAANFSEKTLLDNSRMTIPKKADVSKKLKEVEEAAKKALGELTERAEQSQEPVDPAQFQQSQQQIIQQFKPILDQIRSTVVIEDVMEMLRDENGRNLVIDIETDSTVLTDEMGEKASRAEFLNAVTSASAGTTALLGAGESGARLAGGILKFALQPYRANRELDALIDDFVDNAGQMVAPDGSEEQAGLIEAQNKLAEAEIQKAKAATMSVEARAASETQKLQAKVFELQQKAANDERKSQLEVATLQGKLSEQEAKVNLLQAQTAEILNRIGLDERKQNLEEYQAASNEQTKQVELAMSAEDRDRQAVESERSYAMGERQQSFNEQRAQMETAE